MRLNLNDNIRVKLTEHGKDIYYHQYDRTNKLLGREVCKPSYPKVDEDGYTTFQLWCFMELYGVHMGMTLPNVIEPLDIVFDEPTIDPERKTGKWVGAIEYCKHLEETTGERYQPSSLAGMIYCNQCWKASDRRSNYCRECGSYNWEGGDRT